MVEPPGVRTLLRDMSLPIEDLRLIDTLGVYALPLYILVLLLL